MKTASASYTAWREIGTDLGPHDLVDVVGGAVRSLRHRPEHREPLGRDPQTVRAEKRIGVNGCLPANGGLFGHARSVSPRLDRVQIWLDTNPGHRASDRAALAECENSRRASRHRRSLRLGGRRDGVGRPRGRGPPAHRTDRTRCAGGTDAQREQTSRRRCHGCAGREGASVGRSGDVSSARRARRRTARADRVDLAPNLAARLPRRHRASNVACRTRRAPTPSCIARCSPRPRTRATGTCASTRERSRRAGGQHSVRARRRDPARSSGTIGAALGEGPSGRARRDHRRRLTAAMLMLRRR